MGLTAKGLCVYRGDRCLFSGLDLALAEGELLYVSGPNGSGKTTLLRLLCGLTVPEDGTILWDGKSIRQQGDDYRRELFYFGHLNGIKADLSALENLQMNAALAGQSVSEEDALDALELLGLASYEDLPTKVLSQGQKRRVALARLWLTQAKLWVLDEPFTALDVAAVALLRDRMRAHLDGQGMIILTTHQDVDFGRSVRQLKLGQSQQGLPT